MRKIVSDKIHSDLRNLLTYATPVSRIDQEYDRYIKLPNRYLYGYEKNKTMVGCIGVAVQQSAECEIIHIAVSPEERRNGIGKNMIRFICEEHNLHFINAETDKEAVNFYRRLGFEVTSLGEKYPGVERFLCRYIV